MGKDDNRTITLVRNGVEPVKVCDIVDGKPKVIRTDRTDCIEFELRYSLFEKKIKRYDKYTFEELEVPEEDNKEEK